MKLPRPAITLLIVLFCLVLVGLVVQKRVSVQASATTNPIAVDDGPIDVHHTKRLDQIIFANDIGTPPLSLNVICQNPQHGFLSFGDGTQVIYTSPFWVGSPRPSVGIGPRTKSSGGDGRCVVRSGGRRLPARWEGTRWTAG